MPQLKYASRYREALPATAFIGRVRVLELEAAADELVAVTQFQPEEIEHRLRVDDHLEALGPLLDVVLLRDVVLFAQVHRIRHARTAPRLDAHPQVRAGALGRAELRDVVLGLGGDCNDIRRRVRRRRGWARPAKLLNASKR